MQPSIAVDQKVYRKDAVPIVKHTVGTLAVYDSTKNYDFNPL
jgi:hypothetical protein